VIEDAAADDGTGDPDDNLDDDATTGDGAGPDDEPPAA